MSDAVDPQSLIDAAEQSAAQGDYATAERLLRKAAVLQEASLGPLHPELAHTLNNLGVVCEIVDNPIDAEHYFRRACAIATAVLEPDHPFVATSRKNLEDFCAARGKPVNLPAAVSLVTGGPWTVPAGGSSSDAPRDPPPSETPRAVAIGGWSRPRIVTVLAACLLLTLALAALLRSREPTEPPSGPVVSSSRSPATAESPRREPAARVAPAETKRSDSGSPSARPPRTVASATVRADGGNRTASRSVPGAPTVADARLCRTLSTRGRGGWRCDPPTNPLNAGPLFFYTRLKSPATLTVQHRWYRGDHLRRVVPLVVHANMSEGYRTFSRQTVTAEGSGEWRVELGTTDGAVLHEERFVVR
jgi:hypothetical protein